MQLLYCKVFINDVCILSLVNSLFLKKLLLWCVDSEYHFSRYTIKKTLLFNFCLNFFLFIQYLPSTLCNGGRSNGRRGGQIHCHFLGYPPLVVITIIETIYSSDSEGIHLLSSKKKKALCVKLFSCRWISCCSPLGF